MPHSTIWNYDTPTGNLRLEGGEGAYRLMGEFDGKTHELATGPDLKALIMSLSSSADTTPFMEGIKALRNQGEANDWKLHKMAACSTVGLCHLPTQSRTE